MADSHPQPSDQASCSASSEETPVVALIIGMAGAGKTTLLQQINAYMSTNDMNGYLINLDPAVLKLPYEPNIDIRDTVNYKNVMKEYKLGPNGGILTACNLFATRFDQVMKLCEQKRDPPLQHIMVDTPGQIEIFTWSASGNIVTELFATSMPTVVVYVIDTPRCMNPQTFMSNMMQACSILYKTRLPIIIVKRGAVAPSAFACDGFCILPAWHAKDAFNKVDVTRHEFAMDWMSDYDKFQNALDLDSSYAATLSRSLAMVLDEFYAKLKAVGVSAVTGEGMAELFQAIHEGAGEYKQFYLPELEKRKADVLKAERQRQQEQLDKIKKDVEAGRPVATGEEDAGLQE